jgi:hypothetical protein
MFQTSDAYEQLQGTFQFCQYKPPNQQVDIENLCKHCSRCISYGITRNLQDCVNDVLKFEENPKYYHLLKGVDPFSPCQTFDSFGKTRNSYFELLGQRFADTELNADDVTKFVINLLANSKEDFDQYLIFDLEEAIPIESLEKLEQKRKEIWIWFVSKDNIIGYVWVSKITKIPQM